MSRKDQVGDGDGAGIDEGIARDAALEFELYDGIERAPRGLAADASPQPVADLAQGERERKDFGNALDRKRRGAVARRGDMALRIDHHQAESLGVDACEFRDIAGNLAPVGPLPHLFGYFFYDKVKVGHGAARLTAISPREPVASLGIERFFPST